MNLYNLPKYYDLSYSYNMRDELAFLKQAFIKFSTTERPRLLEPACGTGRLLVPLARAGFYCTGFDLNQSALNYLKKKLHRNDLKADLYQANMADFKIKGPKFDGAYCTVDTFRHLFTDNDALSHLHNVARYLGKNGIYVLGLHLLPRQGIKKKIHRWQGSRGRLTVRSDITVLDVNRKKREETLRYTLRTSKQKYQSDYKLRTYTLQQFKNLLARANCFEIVNVYDLDYDFNQPLKLNHDSEETVFILRKVT